MPCLGSNSVANPAADSYGGFVAVPLAAAERFLLYAPVAAAGAVPAAADPAVPVPAITKGYSSSTATRIEQWCSVLPMLYGRREKTEDEGDAHVEDSVLRNGFIWDGPLHLLTYVYPPPKEEKPVAAAGDDDDAASMSDASIASVLIESSDD